jgi:serine/threonine protein kinase
MPAVPKSDGAGATSRPDELVGSILNERYQILRLLNEGGMAKIYVAKHTVLGREVAIKVLKGGCADDTDVVQRFINEGRAAGTLGHPNIVECTDIGTTPDGKPYLVLELLQGHSLAEEINRSGPLAIGRAAKIASRIADALATAHMAGIVHRDLKSDNVFLARKRGIIDWVKVLDFGVSKFGSDPVGTQKGSMLGTPDFMAPEQVVDACEVDSRADIYALGVILYEMLTGRRPFHGVAFPMVLYAIAHEVPPRVGTFRDDVPEEILAVVDKAMSKDPEDRQASMVEIVETLEPFVERVSMDTSMDDLVASSSAKLTMLQWSELQQLGDEKPRSSKRGGAPTSSRRGIAPTSATLPNPTTATVPNTSDKKPSRSFIPFLGAVGIGVAMGIGMYALMWVRSNASQNEAALVPVAQPQRDIVGGVFNVTPPEASVEVDGRPVANSKGVVKIEGIVGTVRHVRAFVGLHEARAEVVISLNGPIPSRIDVPVPALAPSASAAFPAVSPSASTSAAAPKWKPPPPPRAPQGVDEF